MIWQLTLDLTKRSNHQLRDIRQQLIKRTFSFRPEHRSLLFHLESLLVAEVVRDERVGSR